MWSLASCWGFDSIMFSLGSQSYHAVLFHMYWTLCLFTNVFTRAVCHCDFCTNDIEHQAIKELSCTSKVGLLASTPTPHRSITDCMFANSIMITEWCGKVHWSCSKWLVAPILYCWLLLEACGKSTLQGGGLRCHLSLAHWQAFLMSLWGTSVSVAGSKQDEYMQLKGSFFRRFHFLRLIYWAHKLSNIYGR